MTQTFNEDVDINGKLTVDGEADETQVTVRAHSIQTQPLQSWQDNTGEGLVEVASDGRLQVGDDPVSGTPEALLEVNRVAGSASKPKRGLHVAGEIADDDSDDLKLSVHELTLSGNNTTTQKATALNVRTTVDNADVDEVVGLEVGVESLNGGTMGEAIGLQINDVTDGVTNYALKTGAGQVQLGDLTTGLVETDADGNLSTVTSVAAGYLPTMTGADGVNPGSNGMVPAPAADDNTKYLRGDGQWVQPSFDIGADGVSQFPINESEMLSINAGSNVTVDYDVVGKSVTINADAAPYVPPSDGVTAFKSEISQVVNTTANPGIVLDLLQVESCSDFIFDSVTNRITCQRAGRYYLSGGIANRRGSLLTSSTTVIISLWKVNMSSDTFIGQAYSTYEGNSSTIVYDTAMFSVYFDAVVEDQFYFTATALNAAGSGNLVVFADAQQTITIRDAYMAGPSGDNIELQRDDDFVQWRVDDGVSDWQNLFSLTELNGVDAPYISLKSTGVNQTLEVTPNYSNLLFEENLNSGDFSFDPVSGKITVLTPGLYLINVQFPIAVSPQSNQTDGLFVLMQSDASNGNSETILDTAVTKHGEASSGLWGETVSIAGKIVYLDIGDKIWVKGHAAKTGTTRLIFPSWAGSLSGITIMSVEKNGPRGYNIELQNNGTHVQWRQDDGSASWQDLFSLSTIEGMDAPYFYAQQPATISQSFVKDTFTVVNLDMHQNSGDFSFLSNVVTVNTPGIYTIVGTVNTAVYGIASTTGATSQANIIYKSNGGSAVNAAVSHLPVQYNSQFANHTPTVTLQLNSGDQIWLETRYFGNGVASSSEIADWGTSSLLIFSPAKRGPKGDSGTERSIKGLSTYCDRINNNAVIVVETGSCLDSTGTTEIVIENDVTIHFTVGNVVNGADTFPGYSSQVYYIHAIANDDGSNTGAFASLSKTTPNLPVGYTKFRMIGFASVSRLAGSPSYIYIENRFFTDAGYPMRKMYINSDITLSPIALAPLTSEVTLSDLPPDNILIKSFDISLAAQENGIVGETSVYVLTEDTFTLRYHQGKKLYFDAIGDRDRCSFTIMSNNVSPNTFWLSAQNDVGRDMEVRVTVDSISYLLD